MSSEHQWTRDEVLAYNAEIIEEFRANGGRVAAYPAESPILLLTTVGAKSGAHRTSPVSYSLDGDAIVVIGSNAGSAHHPHWYFNVLANPMVTVELPGDTFAGRARVLTGDERAARLEAEAARLVTQRSRTTREFPVVLIERTG